MALNKTVLVLTQQLDFHADMVIAELNRRRVPVVRFDTADFPLRATLIAHNQAGSWNGAIVTEHRTIAFDQIESIWYRRPTPFELDPTLSLSGQQFASAEARMALGGLLRSVDCLWVNHPEKMVSADYKPYQLKVACECGLEVPASLITNDSRAVLDFFERCKGEMIYKTLSGGMIVAESGEVVSVYTSRVTRDDLRDEGNRVRYTACLFQELVPKKVELRITVVGDHAFPAEISYAHPERATIDWRTAYQDLRYGIHELPTEIHRKCLALVHNLGLSFAAIDMIVIMYNQMSTPYRSCQRRRCQSEHSCLSETQQRLGYDGPVCLRAPQTRLSPERSLHVRIQDVPFLTRPPVGIWLFRSLHFPD